jgi:hypothetical protein
MKALRGKTNKKPTTYLLKKGKHIRITSGHLEETF